MPRSVVTLVIGLGLLAAGLGVGLAAPAGAGAPAPITYRVTTTADVLDGAGNGYSLRDAFKAAREDGVDSRIVLGLDQSYALTLCGPGVDEGALRHSDLNVGTNEALRLEGRGSTVTQTCTGAAVILQFEYGTFDVRDVTITGGEASGIIATTGYGISLFDVVVTGNSTATDGGGLLTGGGGSATIVRSTFSGNDAGSEGGGASVNGVATVVDSTFSGNGSADTDLGGGLFSPTSGVQVTRSTFSGNAAAQGAAIGASGVYLEQATIAGDDPGPGGAAVVSPSTLQAGGSIVQPVDGVACSLGGATTSLGSNRSSDASCALAGAGDDGTSVVALGPLASNGGPTQTRLPLAVPGVGEDSVVDAIPASEALLCGLHDQRGVEQPQGVGCEIGSVEVPSPFSDVGPTNPFFLEIAWMDDSAITTGYDDGTFRPSSGVTRGAMAAFLYRASEDTFSPPLTATFPDVSTSHPFFLEIEWLADSEITGGYGDGTFRPAATVTRQAMAAFLYRFVGEPPFTDPTTPSFSDVGTGNTFFTEIEWMADEGISSGYVDGTWRPGVNVSRQAMAHFLFVGLPS